MNRNEKNAQTRQHIMNRALAEFSEKSYSDASINTICATGALSKGIIYHYFKDKDELYLVCVKECFDTLTHYLSKIISVDDVPIAIGLECYFDARVSFFCEYPLYLGVFCSAVMHPPMHLSAAIDQIRTDFDTQAATFLTALLQSVKLRPDVTLQEVVAVFREYQDFINTRFQKKTAAESTLKEHEERCHRSLQILLYGIIERKD